MTSACFAEVARTLAGQAGLLLGWRPDEFWRATPAELADALAVLRDLAGPQVTPFDRSALAKMMERHPDG
ncbi:MULTISPECIES: phage tail assembly chaperone [Sphingobium]|uniref:phage tail assembly chaperone n=1 Tax=Sphingobium TaxID=165695 RepID=UPI0015EC8179|nr:MULTISPECIES: phage tail assembly chaperone [Sphingobium]MCW2364286.1 putative phage protein (TIGR02216 family) [Sphingobium sp. B10D3B]MCW2367203.1 putative phage protein (TIGR02216 family) [Sphingobium sp. B7D2B]MCW2402317.1 putative phage protein (TIGR02216 family) [Sphingobium sp. B10D7B]MCW2409296.1 putative phage protein (TIGR02216 family) [Sphingobium xanthum]